MTFGIQPVARSPGAFDFPVTLAWCSETHLFGGASFGAVVEALEQASAKPLLGASIQFLERGRLDTTLRIATRLLAEGKAVAQAQAEARVANASEDSLIIAVSATLGTMGRSAATPAPFPTVPKADGLPVRKYLRALPGSITDTQDIRFVGVDGHRVRLWSRLAQGEGPLSAAILAMLSDQVSGAAGFVMGVEKWWGLTLDGNLRIASDLGVRGARDWVLLDIRFDALNETFGHGAMEMWAEDGTLLAVAAQTVRMRRW
jgi:acyl-CoA thioesterase